MRPAAHRVRRMRVGVRLEPPGPHGGGRAGHRQARRTHRLDQAIGDGDHGVNMKRGFEAVLDKLDAIVAQPLGEAIKAVGRRW